MRRALHHLARGALTAAAGVLVMTADAPQAFAACSHLGPAIIDHTCLHVRFGPFASVTTGAGHSLDSVHTYYSVALGGAPSGTVAYTPARSGEWAFYVQYDVPLEVREPSGVALAASHVDAVPGCPFLARVEVVTLTANTTYQVAIGPTTASVVGVVIEKLDDFIAIHGRDRDGDGFGDPDDFVVSPCLPEPGYVANDGDCDDADPRVHPGASERCDDPDLNCNGTPGDAGAGCTVGLGACAVEAIAACPQADAAPVCDATPAAAGVEICNGIDDDCDGTSDADEELCGDPSLPRCVSDGKGGRFCGCESDADCGPPESARLCSLRGTEQRCIDGCVDGFQRNHCPAGQRCTSADPAQPGTCVDAGAGDPAGCGCGTTSVHDAGLLLLLGVLWGMRRRRSLLAATAGSRERPPVRGDEE